jgi:hypothetical protein
MLRFARTRREELLAGEGEAKADSGRQGPAFLSVDSPNVGTCRHRHPSVSPSAGKSTLVQRP